MIGYKSQCRRAPIDSRLPFFLGCISSPHSVINDDDSHFHGVVRMYFPGIPPSTSPRGPCVTRHSTGVTLYLYRSFMLILVTKINLQPSILRRTTHNTIRLRQLNTWNNGNRKPEPPKTRNIRTSFLYVIKTLSRYHNHQKLPELLRALHAGQPI